MLSSVGRYVSCNSYSNSPVMITIIIIVMRVTITIMVL